MQRRGSNKERRTALDPGGADLDVDLTDFGLYPGRCILERRMATNLDVDPTVFDA